MTRLKNISFTLFRYQNYIWRPGEIITFNDNGLNLWEDRLAHELTTIYKNLVPVTDEQQKRTPEELKQFRIENLKKARAARKAKHAESNPAA